MNTLKQEEAPASSLPRKKKRGRSIQRILNGDFLAREGLVNHLPFISFLAFLFLMHISLIYYFEHTQSELSKMHRDLNEVRSGYNTTMSELERKRQQSTIAEDIQSIGLKELRTPPQVIDVKKGFLDKDK